MKVKDPYSSFEEVCVDEVHAGCAEVSSREYFQNDDEKIKIIAGHFKEIMQTLGLDLGDDSLKETP
jgi:GTP cyclohydrolase I